jgi:hypothetical protein
MPYASQDNDEEHEEMEDLMDTEVKIRPALAKSPSCTEACFNNNNMTYDL